MCILCGPSSCAALCDLCDGMHTHAQTHTHSQMHKVEAILANMEEEAVAQHQVHDNLLVAYRTLALDG